MAHILKIPDWGLTIKAREKLFMVIGIVDNQEDTDVFLGIVPVASKEKAVEQAIADMGDVFRVCQAFDLLSLISECHTQTVAKTIIDGLLDSK